ncbi:MAG: hypothetical protein AAF533_11170 [Acidobacteriota bacterium]
MNTSIATRRLIPFLLLQLAVAGAVQSRTLPIRVGTPERGGGREIPDDPCPGYGHFEDDPCDPGNVAFSILSTGYSIDSGFSGPLRGGRESGSEVGDLDIGHAVQGVPCPDEEPCLGPNPLGGWIALGERSCPVLGVSSCFGPEHASTIFPLPAQTFPDWSAPDCPEKANDGVSIQGCQSQVDGSWDATIRLSSSSENVDRLTGTWVFLGLLSLDTFTTQSAWLPVQPGATSRAGLADFDVNLPPGDYHLQATLLTGAAFDVLDPLYPLVPAFLSGGVGGQAGATPKGSFRGGETENWRLSVSQECGLRLAPMVAGAPDPSQSTECTPCGSN